MKITIVTVSYNAATTIADTIGSVQAQDHVDVEHIIVDGASRDGTQAIVERLADARTTFVSEPDRGLYDAMNKGIALATGDVIGILNADDFLADPSVLSRIARAFSDSPGLDAVLGDIVFLPSRLGLARRYDSGRFHPGRIGWGWMPAHPGMYLTREAYARVGRYDTGYQIAADFDFVVRAFGKEKVRYVHLPDIFVKMRPGGISTSGLSAKLVLNREMMKACRNHGIKTNWPKLLSKYVLKSLEYLRH